mgnify:CR=1 FL=1
MFVELLSKHKSLVGVGTAFKKSKKNQTYNVASLKNVTYINSKFIDLKLHNTLGNKKGLYSVYNFDSNEIYFTEVGNNIEIHQPFKKIFNGGEYIIGNIGSSRWHENHIGNIDLIWSTLASTVLKNVAITHSYFYESNFIGNVYDITVFENCEFNNMKFKESEFLNVKFYKCTFTNTEFSSLTISGCRFTECNFTNIKFIDCCIFNTLFWKTNMKNITFISTIYNNMEFLTIKGDNIKIDGEKKTFPEYSFDKIICSNKIK